MVPGMSSPPRKTTPPSVGRLTAEASPSQPLAARFPKPGYHAALQKRSANRSISSGLGCGVLILSWRSRNEPEPGETALYIDPVAYRPGDGLCRICRRLEPGARLCE